VAFDRPLMIYRAVSDGLCAAVACFDSFSAYTQQLGVGRGKGAVRVFLRQLMCCVLAAFSCATSQLRRLCARSAGGGEDGRCRAITLLPELQQVMATCYRPLLLFRAASSSKRSTATMHD
jgi:hypothetical protein